LQTLKSRVAVGTNLLDIDRWAQTMIAEGGALSCYVDYEPSFGRGPFGHYICTAVNDAVLHGLPYDYTLADSPSPQGESLQTLPSASSWANQSPRRASR
jgi:methionyl aminopeptidase